MDSCKCGQPNCLGHEQIGQRVFIPGFTDLKLLQASPHLIVVFDEEITIMTEVEAASEAQAPLLFLAQKRPSLSLSTLDVTPPSLLLLREWVDEYRLDSPNNNAYPIFLG